MIHSFSIPGAWYADARPGGRWVAVFPGGGCRTEHGDIPPTPEGGLLFPRLGPPGRFAGQGHGGPHNWEWMHDHWEPRSPSCGVSPVIYRGFELIENFNCAAGTQGFRYVRADGTIASGDETYFDPTLSLNEWTDLGDGIRIGQDNATDNATIVRGEKRYQLADGRCRFIRATREGDVIAVGLWRESHNEALIFEFKLSDIETLPEMPSGSPPPPPPPPPPPMPEPPNHSAIAFEVMNANRHLFDGTRESGRELCRLVVKKLRETDSRWGLNWKRGVEGDQSADVIAYRFDNGLVRLVDIILAFDDPDPVKRQPAWGVIGVEEAGVTGWFWTEDEPEPEPEPAPTCNCRPELEELNLKLADTRAQLEGLRLQLKELAERPTPEFDVVVDPSAPEIGTGRSWGHSHSIRLKVVRK